MPQAVLRSVQANVDEVPEIATANQTLRLRGMALPNQPSPHSLLGEDAGSQDSEWGNEGIDGN